MIARQPDGSVNYIGNIAPANQGNELYNDDVFNFRFYQTGTLFLENLEPANDNNSQGSNNIILKVNNISDIRIYQALKPYNSSNRSLIMIKIFKVKENPSRFYLEFINDDNFDTYVQLGDLPSKPSTDELELVHVITGSLAIPASYDRNIISFTDGSSYRRLQYNENDAVFSISNGKARSQITAPALQLSLYSDDNIRSNRDSVEDQFHNTEIDINQIKNSINEINSVTTSIYVSR